MIIRPHHTLCLNFFVGHGYDQWFIEKTNQILDRLNKDEVLVRIKIGCDEVCEACPHRTGNQCKFEESVLSKDRSILDFIGLEDGAVIRPSDLKELVMSKTHSLKDVSEVCGKCEYSGLCNEQLSKRNHQKN